MGKRLVDSGAQTSFCTFYWSLFAISSAFFCWMEIMKSNRKSSKHKEKNGGLFDSEMNVCTSTTPRSIADYYEVRLFSIETTSNFHQISMKTGRKILENFLLTKSNHNSTLGCSGNEWGACLVIWRRWSQIPIYETFWMANVSDFVHELSCA